MFKHKWFIISTVSLVIIFVFTLSASASTQRGPAIPSEPARQALHESNIALGTGFTTAPLGSGFAYQGFLKGSGGTPVSDTCSFKFTLYGSLDGSDQIGDPDEVYPVAVSAGYFTAIVNEGNEFSSTDFNGEARWLQVEVKCGSEVDYTTLSPRQPLMLTPYASYAVSAPWSGLTDVPAGFADGTDNIGTPGTGLELLFDNQLSLVPSYRLPQYCEIDSIPKWNDISEQWWCAGDQTGSGDITGVSAGTGLSGGGLSGDVTLGITTTYRLPQGCTSGQVVKWNGTSLYWECNNDNNTTQHSALSGLNADDHPQYFNRSQNETITGIPNFNNIDLPFSVSSTTRVLNLNADLLDGLSNGALSADIFDGYHVGNASGQIPINNGVINVNLNCDLLDDKSDGFLSADLLDGYNAGNDSGRVAVNNTILNTNLNADRLDSYHADNTSGSIPISNGILNVNLNADLLDGLSNGALSADILDGYHAGNSPGQIPVSNGTLNSNLNAGLLDGYTSSDFASSTHNHWGQSWSGGGTGLTLSGVYGLDAIGSTYGVSGNTSSGKGVQGYATASSGTNYGVYGTTSSPAGYGGFFYNSGGGIALEAKSSTYTDTVFLVESTGHGPVFKVIGDGNVYADGTYYGAGGVSAGSADFAEMVPPGQAELEPGDVLAIDTNGQMIGSSKPYQTNVAGVYSTKPGFIAGNQLDEEGKPLEPERIPLAVVGIVPVKASAENGAIQPGDLLTTSATPGHAMRAGPNPPIGTVIGKALQGLESGTGMILVLVMLQ